MSEWKKYPRNRLIEEKKGFFLIVPDDFEEKSKDIMPIFCEVCNFAFFRPEDYETFKKFHCCSVCADTWAYSKKDDWKNGWRPSKEQIMSSIEKRDVVDQSVRFE